MSNLEKETRALCGCEIVVVGINDAHLQQEIQRQEARLCLTCEEKYDEWVDERTAEHDAHIQELEQQPDKGNPCFGMEE